MTLEALAGACDDVAASSEVPSEDASVEYNEQCETTALRELGAPIEKEDRAVEVQRVDDAEFLAAVEIGRTSVSCDDGSDIKQLRLEEEAALLTLR